MPDQSSNQVRTLCYVTLGASLVGGISGHFWLLLTLSLAGWSFYHALQFDRLSRWLGQPSSQPAPKARGSWAEVIANLVHQRQQQTQNERHLHAVIKRFKQSSAAIPDAIIIIDKKMNMEWWNRAAEHLLDLRRKTDRGKPLINFLRDPLFVNYFLSGNYEKPLELLYPKKENTYFRYFVTEFGSEDRLLVVQDISTIKSLEQTRQDFVANASHELRTPLTVLKGYLETFLGLGDLQPGVTRGLEQMQTQCKRMEVLVEDLLLLSQLEGVYNPSELVPINVQSMLVQLFKEAEQLAASKGIQVSLKLDDHYDVLGRPKELYSALINLVSNAVRYTPVEGNIQIVWKASRKGGKISVRDDGIGIEPSHIPRLTERFYRVDSARASSSGGTGLGLAIVKHALVIQGASLGVKSRYGQGSVFNCQFPRSSLIRLKRKQPKSESSQPQPPAIPATPPISDR